MKHLNLIWLCFIVGCNSGGGSGGGGTPNSTTPWNSHAVDTSSDLPTCTGDISGRLYYLEST